MTEPFPHAGIDSSTLAQVEVSQLGTPIDHHIETDAVPHHTDTAKDSIEITPTQPLHSDNITSTLHMECTLPTDGATDGHTASSPCSKSLQN